MTPEEEKALAKANKQKEKELKLQQSQFRLKEHQVLENKFTIVSLSRKRSITINRGKSPIEHNMFKDLPDGKLPVASSEDLKTVYDSNKCWAEYIDAPDDYNAPWASSEGN